MVSPETKAILDALLEGRKVVEAKLDSMGARLDSMGARLDSMEARLDSMEARLDSMDARLDSMAEDVGTIKEHLADARARDQYLMQKTGELEAELFVVKRRQKA